jgi:hypothetical protein
MRKSITRTVGIKAPAARVIASLSRIENLPDSSRIFVQTGKGGGAEAMLPARPRALASRGWPAEVVVDDLRGTVDYFWTTQCGLEVAAARVIPMDGESQVVVTFFEAPDDCDRCSSLEERSAAVEADLLMLKALLERGAEPKDELWH